MADQTVANPYYRDSLVPTRIKLAKTPKQSDWDEAEQSSDEGTAAGGIADPSSLLPNQPQGQLAQAATPDFARMKALQDQSAIMQGFAAMRARPTRGNINPQPMGDNALTAFVKARNQGELSRIQQQTAGQQTNVDLYNKLLENRQTQVKNYADINASQDIPEHEADMKQKGQLAEDAIAGRVQVAGVGAGAKGATDASRQAIAAARNASQERMTGVRTEGMVDAAHMRLAPKMAEKVQQLDALLDNARLLDKAHDDSIQWVKDHPTPLLDAANATGFTPAAEVMGKVSKEFDSTDLSRAEPFVRLKGLRDTQVAANSKYGRPTSGQLQILDADLPSAEDPSYTRIDKMQQAKQKNQNLIRSLEQEREQLYAQPGATQSAPNAPDNLGTAAIPAHQNPITGKKMAPIKAGSELKPTSRYNPATGKIEPIP